MVRSGLVTFILGLFVGLSAFAQSSLNAQVSDALKKEDRRLNAEWRVGLLARDKSNLEAQSKFVDFKLDIKADYRLTSALYLDIQPSFRLQAGQSQSVDGADKAENRILLNQAALHYTPANFLKLSAGALNQRAMHTALLMDELAFPGARVATVLKSGDWKTALAAETSIPTSTSLSTNTNEIEPTPSLTSASLQLVWGAREELQWKNQVGFFSYANLPSAVAKDSNFLGNEVEQLTASKYRFLYEFQGFEFGTQVTLPVSKVLDLKIGAEYLQNTKAPSDVNSGYQVYGGGDVHINKDYDLCGKFTYYSIAPEAAVSYFNARVFETNRIGYAAEGFVTFKQEGFKMGLSYSDAELMYNDRDQSRQKSIILKLETFYANI
jgi:hypothetical protein